MPSVEDAILARFNKGKKPFPQLAECIFQDNIETSRQMLQKHGFFDIPIDLVCRMLTVHKNQCVSFSDLFNCYIACGEGFGFNVDNIRQVLSSSDNSFTLYKLVCNPQKIVPELQNNEESVEELQKRLMPKWRPKLFLNNASLIETVDQNKQLTWLLTVFYRTNVAHLLYKIYMRSVGRDIGLKHKIEAFVENHLSCVQYIDKNGPFDDMLDDYNMEDTHVSLGISYHEEDANLVKTKERTHVRRHDPLDVIETAYPDFLWTIEEVAEGPLLDYYQKHNNLSNLQVGKWQPLEYTSAPFHEYRVYWACMFILNQLDTCMHNCDLDHHRDGNLYDMLFIYYACFLDLFYYMLPIGMDDATLYSFINDDQEQGITYLEYYYPYSNRAFSAHDLPNLYHVFSEIPLWGEQVTPDTMIGKILQKSCPFACQRRQLIVSTANTIRNDQSFWLVFSRVFWLMLSGLYPGSLRPKKENRPSFRRLLRCMQLTDPVQGKELLLKAITRESIKTSVASSDGSGSGTNGGPLIVFLAFRLYILYMTSFHPTYLEKARKCINWDAFEQETCKMAELVRESNIFPEDAFAVARALLCRNTKNSKNKVYRYRKYSCIVTMHETMTKILEKKVMRELQEWERELKTLQDLQESVYSSSSSSELSPEFNANNVITKFKKTFASTFYSNELAKRKQKLNRFNIVTILNNAINMSKSVISRLGVEVPDNVRANILNLLVRIPEHKRLHAITMLVLTEEPYGGISKEAVENMIRMVHVYQKSGMPKDYERHVRAFNTYDFKVICWFWNVLSVIENIHLIKLDSTTVKRIDYAMANKRFILFPGQKMTPYAYDVFITICCNNITTLQGQNSYGHNDIAYNLDSQMFVCSRGQKSINAKSKKAAAAVTENDAIRQIEALSSDIFDVTALTTEGDDRKRVRNQRKEFNTIQCGNGQPAFQINMRGYMLLYGNVINKRKMYMHCPECGSWHERRNEYFAALSPYNGLYRCGECIKKDPMFGRRYRECSYCGKNTQAQLNDETVLTVMCPLKDPKDPNFDPIAHPENTEQRLYFCKRHYYIARRYAWAIPKELLWKKIAEKESQKMKKQSQQVFRGKRGF